MMLNLLDQPSDIQCDDNFTIYLRPRVQVYIHWLFYNVLTLVVCVESKYNRGVFGNRLHPPCRVDEPAQILLGRSPVPANTSTIRSEVRRLCHLAESTSRRTSVHIVEGFAGMGLLPSKICAGSSTRQGGCKRFPNTPRSTQCDFSPRFLSRLSCCVVVVVRRLEKIFGGLSPRAVLIEFA
jgi:hypothetical protein